MEVSERMADAGYRRKSRQCREKFKKLKSEYKNVKDHNGKSGSVRKQWRWFDHMDQIYGHHPASRGRECGLDSATLPLEDMRGASGSSHVESENETEDFRSSLRSSESSCSDSTDASPGVLSPPLVSKQRRRSGKRRMEDLADVNEEAENRQQRERHHQAWMKLLQEEANTMADLRREELRQTSQFYTAFLGLMGDMVKTLQKQHD